MAGDTSKCRIDFDKETPLIPRVQEYQQEADLCVEEPINPPSRLRMIWPAFAVGVGLLATLVWTLFLGWLLGRALLAIF
jgi:hypothetical protein